MYVPGAIVCPHTQRDRFLNTFKLKEYDFSNSFFNSEPNGSLFCL